MTTLYTGITCKHRDWLHTPLIEIRPVSDERPLREAAQQASTFDYVLFTSRYAVAPFMRHTQPSLLPLVVAIGPTTAAALADEGVGQVQLPAHDDSYGVVAWFAEQPRGRVLLPRSDLALDIIPAGLRQQGFDVTTVTAYENHAPAHPRQVNLDTIDRIIFTSPSTIDRFIAIYGMLPTDKQLVCRGPVTQQHLTLRMKLLGQGARGRRRVVERQ